MNPVSRYDFAAEYRTGDGVVGERVLDLSFNHAVQSAAFMGMRRGEVVPALRYSGPAMIAPVWRDDVQSRAINAFSVSVPSVDGETFSLEIPKQYAYGAVQRGASKLVSDGLLQDGDLYEYTLYAYDVVESPEVSAEGARRGTTCDRIEEPLHIPVASLADFVRASERRNALSEDEPDVDDMPAFIASSVYDDAVRIARTAGNVEAGGVLVGTLLRDADSSEIFVYVRALIEAQHTLQEHASLTFTSETWASARAAIELRGGSEVMIGWMHSHPFFCKDCSAESRARCPYRTPFFSPHDVSVHGTCFPGGFQIGLLASDLGDNIAVDLFGWRQGCVEKRSFAVVTDDEAPVVAVEAISGAGKENP